MFRRSQKSMNNYTHYWFLLRYGAVGICGGLIQTATLYVWVEIFRLQAYYLLGAAAGFCLALAVTFTLQKYWTFRDYARERARKQFFFYTLIALTSLGLNVLLLHLSKLALDALGFNFFHIWYLAAQVCIIGFVAALSFIANYTITFRTRT